MESERFELAIEDFEAGHILCANGRRMFVSSTGVGQFVSRTDAGVWQLAGSTSHISDCDIDPTQVVVAVSNIITIYPWPDDTADLVLLDTASITEHIDTLAIDGPLLAFGDEMPERVRAYALGGMGWGQDFEQMATPSSSNLGTALDIDGSRLVFSDPQIDSGNTGEVFIRFRNAGGTWIDFGSVKAPGEEMGNGFGISVAVSGSWLAVGAPFEDTTLPQPIATDAGAVYLFKTNGFGFFEHQATIFGTQDNHHFGMSVALDHETLVVGAPGEDANQSPPLFVNRGAAYVYWRDNDSWGLHSKLSATDLSEGDALGTAVAVGPRFVFATAPLNDVMGKSNAGTTYIYDGLIAPLFADDFAAGNTSAWSNAVQ